MPYLHNKLRVTHVIIALCVTVFTVRYMLGITEQLLGLELFFVLSAAFNPLQLLTYMFLHASVSHLLLNMLGLLMFGPVIERVWGAARFTLFYFACGVGAGLIYLLFNYLQFQGAIVPLLESGASVKQVISMIDDQRVYATVYTQFPDIEAAARLYFSLMVGASAAIYAILVAFACLFPNHKVVLLFLPLPIAAKFFVPALLCFDLLSGITGFSIFGANIAHSAHIAGAFMGFVFVCVFRARSKHIMT